MHFASVVARWTIDIIASEAIFRGYNIYGYNIYGLTDAPTSLSNGPRRVHAIYYPPDPVCQLFLQRGKYGARMPLSTMYHSLAQPVPLLFSNIVLYCEI